MSFDFPYNFYLKYSSSFEKSPDRCYYNKFTYVFMKIFRYACQILTKFDKTSNIKFHEKSLERGHSRFLRTDRNDGTDIRISQC